MIKKELLKTKLRTDMALDLDSENKYVKEKYQKGDITVTYMELDEKNVLGKEKGNYLTLEFGDVSDDDEKKLVMETFKLEFAKMLKKEGFNKDFKTLVVGLGNPKMTPDALGCKTALKILVTKHLFDMELKNLDDYTNVCEIHPDVTGVTGIETSDIIKAVADKIKPDLIIFIDALASLSVSRVNKSIQVSNTGITPGAGVGNFRCKLSIDDLNTKVISVGVPTVLESSIIVVDTLNYLEKSYKFHKDLNKNVSKFLSKPVDYKNKDVLLNKDDNKALLGMVGSLSNEDLQRLIDEVLTPIGYNLMVTTKEVDLMIEVFSDILSYGINHSLHEI